jgi:hypothetical protein
MSRPLLKPPVDTLLSPLVSDAAESPAGLPRVLFRWSTAT